MAEAITVGLVGAGPWAATVHAPMLAAGPETRLAAVWARRPEAAADLAAAHGAHACASFAELLDRCDAVAFAVPPDVQEVLAIEAAHAGKGLLLEKPLAGSLDGARRVADAVLGAGVGSLVVFTFRFGAATRRFLADAGPFAAFGGYFLNATGAFLSGPYSRSPWRHARGALLDVGPHGVDLLSAALGDVVDVAARESRGWVQLSLAHERGASSVAMLSCSIPGDPRHVCELFGEQGTLALLERRDAYTFDRLRAEFAAVVRTRAPHECDVRRGLYVQTVIDRAERALTAS
jgi:predicted dehydrogenase